VQAAKTAPKKEELTASKPARIPEPPPSVRKIYESEKPYTIKLDETDKAASALGATKDNLFSIHFKEITIEALVRMLSDRGRNFRYVIHPDVGQRMIFGMALEGVTWREALGIVAKLHNLVTTEEHGLVMINTGENADKAKEIEGKRLEVSEKMAKMESARLAEAAKSKELVDKEKSAFRSFKLKYSDPVEVMAYLDRIFNGGTGVAAPGGGAAPASSPLIAAVGGGGAAPAPGATATAPVKDRLSFAAFSKASILTVFGTQTQLEDVEKRLAEIDVPQQQIYIEARIVEVYRNYSRELGVEWGGARTISGTGTVSGSSVVPPLTVSGTTTTTTGGTTGGTTTTVAPGGWAAGSVAASGNAAVAFPAADPLGSAVAGLSLAVITGTDQLNMRISAMESEGKSKTLSNPKITTINGVTADIKSGREIPYQQQSGGTSGGTTVAFKKAVLSLEVTPFVTPNNMINLKISATKDDADFTNMVAGTPSILTRSVNTTVLVIDGGTAVLGGVFEDSKMDTQKGIPWLQNIPIFGWLFKGLQNIDNEKELLIFITPRIVKGNFS
jgi:type IV pilus assembly protein PilQ